MPSEHTTRRPNRCCDVCGKPYYVRPSHLTETRGRTCSWECGKELRAKLAGSEWRICAICGKRYRAMQYKIKRGEALTCSRPCADESKHRKPGRRTPYTLVCEQCGKVVQGNKHNGRFCSMACAGAAQSGPGNRNYQNRARAGKPQWQPSPEVRHRSSLAKRGSNNPNWEGGGTERPRGSDWNWQRKQARERDNHCCRLCNANENLTVHHITRYRDGGGNELSNLITLCRACHAHIHHLMRRNPDQLPDWSVFLPERKPVKASINAVGPSGATLEGEPPGTRLR